MVGNNHLERLPDELLLHIFDTVRDAWSLTKCLAVSKRFGSLVPLTATVSTSCCWCQRPIGCDPVPIESRFPGEDPRLRAADVVFTSVRFGRRYHVFLPYPRPDHISSRSGDLKGFTEIRSIHVNLIHPDSRDPPAYMHKYCGVQLGGAAQLIKSCVIVDVDGCHGFHPLLAVEGSLAPAIPDSGEYLLSTGVFKIGKFLNRTASIHSLLRQTVFGNPMVRDVVIADARREAIFHAGRDEVTDIRTQPGEHSISVLTRDLSIKLWRVQSLPLPTSGYALTGVTVVVMMNRDVAASRIEDCYGEFLRSYLDVDPRMREDGGDRDRASLIREAIVEMSKVMTLYLAIWRKTYLRQVQIYHKQVQISNSSGKKKRSNKQLDR